MEDPKLRVTKLAQHPEGYWTANVSLNGTTVPVDNRYGSWLALVRQAPHAREFDRREVVPKVAAELQRRLPKEARATRRKVTS